MGSEVKGATQSAVAMMKMKQFEYYRWRKRIGRNRRKERRNVREVENWSLAMASFLYKAARGIRH